MVEQVVRKRVRASGVTDILKLFGRHYGEYLDLPEEVKLPVSWHKLKKLATDGQMPRYTIRDVCPECDWMFPQLPNVQLCQRCKKNTRWLPKKRQRRPARTVLYFSMEDMFRRMFKVPALADALIALTGKPPSDVPLQDRELNEAQDGTILHDLLNANIMQLLPDDADDADDADAEVHDDALPDDAANSDSESEMSSDSDSEQEHPDDEDADQEDQEDEEIGHPVGYGGEWCAADEVASSHTLYLAVTTDGTEVQKGISYTPVTSKVLNLPSSLRSKISNIRLHAVFPPSVQDCNSLLRPFVEELLKHRPAGGSPIMLRHPTTGRLIHLYVHLAYTLNDIRGVPVVTGGHHPPCTEGSCARCKVRGIYRHNRTILPGAVRGLPRNSALRTRSLYNSTSCTVL